MNVATISNFRKEAKMYFDQVIDDDDVLLITRSDGKATVMMTLDQYNSKAETDYLNASPTNRQHLEASIAQIKSGDTVKVGVADLKKYEDE